MSASPRERRAMLEDALGLTPFLYKREEAEKKLQKTTEYIREVESMRRELAPHLHFLQKQVKRIEDAESVREELQSVCLEYFCRENRYLAITGARLSRERSEPVREKMEVDTLVMRLRLEVQAVQSRGAVTGAVAELSRAEREYAAARAEREVLMRDLGMLEGERKAFEIIKQEAPSRDFVPLSEVVSFGEHVKIAIESALHAVDIQSVRTVLEEFSRVVHQSIKRFSSGEVSGESAGAAAEIAASARENDLSERISLAETALRAAQERESILSEAVSVARKHADTEKDAGRDVEKRLFEALSRRSELEAAIARTQALAEDIDRDARNLQEDVHGVAVVLGRAAFDYETHQLVDGNGAAVADEIILAEPRHTQHDRRRKVERLKIRVEESSIANSADVVREYTDARERDEFLARELQDISSSAESLRTLIIDLTRTLRERFDTGLAAVSAEFETFFKEVFGGGEASLEVVADEVDGDEEEINTDANLAPTASRVEKGRELYSRTEAAGVEVSISLPHKRVKSLAMLSGGERALTSIALIFALSHINPPPFLILDETDAALDEANARRYGAVIERLAQRSQLIVVTHNRETMSHAGVLYGVTMGSDGASKILSVRFDEAAAT